MQGKRLAYGIETEHDYNLAMLPQSAWEVGVEKEQVVVEDKLDGDQTL